MVAGLCVSSVSLYSRRSVKAALKLCVLIWIVIIENLDDYYCEYGYYDAELLKTGS